MIKFKEYITEAKVPDMVFNTKSAKGDTVTITVTDKIEFNFSGNASKEISFDEYEDVPFKNAKVELSFEDWIEKFSKLTANGGTKEFGKDEFIMTQGGKYANLEYRNRMDGNFVGLTFKDVKEIIKFANKAVKYAMKSSGVEVQGKVIPGVEFKVQELEGTKYGAHGNTSSPIKRINVDDLSYDFSVTFKTNRFILSDKTTAGKGNSLFLSADDKILKQIDGKEISTTICNKKGCAYGQTSLKITLKRV